MIVDDNQVLSKKRESKNRKAKKSLDQDDEEKKFRDILIMLVRRTQSSAP